MVINQEEGVDFKVRTQCEDYVDFDSHIEQLGKVERKVKNIIKANRDLENEQIPI